ncbi:MAG: DNA-3-methyladenine glycosylase I [Candidatus Kryptoniota bacterium]
MTKSREQELTRCPWPTDDSMMIEYHDKEWGVPIHDDRKIFEFLVLEGMQAGLSWSTILHKRENFRKAFDNFDVEKIAKYDSRKIRRLLSDAGIIRNRLKLQAAVNNARQFIKVQEEFGSFDKYVWQFVDGHPIVNARETLKHLPARTNESDKMSKALKERGFKFVGTTICYAHMQAAGMVNDHMVNCFRYADLK